MTVARPCGFSPTSPHVDKPIDKPLSFFPSYGVQNFSMQQVVRCGLSLRREAFVAS